MIGAEWPHRALVGDGALDPVALADAVRRATRADPRHRVSLARVLSAGRFRFRIADLAAAQGGREALLLPMPGDQFAIVVDPTPLGGWGHFSHSVQRVTALARVRFRLAHEIGHSFFYLRGCAEPTRLTAPGSANEETFCDRFAEALLIPRAVVRCTKPTPAEIFEVARTWGVSVEAAARAVSNGHPGRPAIAVFHSRAGLVDWTRDLQWSNGLRITADAVHLPCAAANPRELLSVETGGDAAVAAAHLVRRQIVAVAR